MGVLHAVADLDEELEPLVGGKLVGVAVLGDGNARHVLHDEVGPALGRASPVEDLGDGRMVHERQGLALDFEAGHHLLGVHARLDDLDGHLAPDGSSCSASHTSPMPPSPMS